MANESVRITNGTVAMLSKVLREVQEVQSREVEVSQQPQQQQQQDTLQFNVGYVSLLKSRFAKSDQPPVDESKKKQLSARRDFAHGHVVTVTKSNAAVSDIVSQQDTPTFSSTPNIIVREVAQEREHDSAFQIIEPSIVQSSQTPNASPASNQSADEAHRIPDESVALQELPNTQAVPDSVVPAKSKVSQDSLKSKEEQTASIHNLKLMFEKLAVKKGNSQRTTYAAGSGSTSEGNLTSDERLGNVRSLLANFSSNCYSITNTYLLHNGSEPRTGLLHSRSVPNASVGRFSNQITPTAAQSAVINEELHSRHSAYENRYSSERTQTQRSEPFTYRVGQAESGDQSRHKLDVHKQTALETGKEQGKTVNIAADALVRIRNAGASWFFGANVKAAEVPPGCILFQVGLHPTEAAASSESKTRFQRLFGLLPSGAGAGASARQSAGNGHRPVNRSTARTAVTVNANAALSRFAFLQARGGSRTQGSSTQLTAFTTNAINTQTTPKSDAAAQLTLQLTDSLAPGKAAKSAPANANTNGLKHVDATPNSPPPSYVDLVQSFNLKQSNASASASANASASDAPQSSGPYSAYALFSVLRPQTNKSQDDDDDFASSSNEERESKLRSAADRIQVAGANVHLAKSAFLSDARRKASVDFTCTMADREKDTLTVSEEASALAADRNRRISFNDAAIAVTHEYPREESWNEDSENEPDAQAADNVDADADCSGDAVEVEQNQNEGEEEEEDDDGVTKSRLYALFALNSQDSHSTRSQLPTYDSVQQDHVDKLTNTRTDDEINLQSDGDSLSSSAHHPTLPAASEQNDVMTRTIDIANITRSNGAEVAEILYSDPL